MTVKLPFWLRMPQSPGNHNLFPELALFADDAERGRAYGEASRQAANRLRGTPRYWASLIGFLIIMICPTAMYLIGVIPGSGRYLPEWLEMALLATGGSLFGAYALQRFWREPMRRELRKKLRERGVALCIECGYDLRGQTEPRCPECGAAFDPGLLGRNL